MPHLVCFGFGFTAARLAAAVIADGWQVTGTVRDPAARPVPAGVMLHRFGDDLPLDDASHVLLSIPPGEDGDPALIRYGAALQRTSTLTWIGYLSTTGVYGDAGGRAVGEDSPLDPVNARGHRRIAGERAWLDLGQARGIAVNVFRLSGIYGPGRSAVDRILNGTARRIDKPDQLFSRIHVDDIVAALRAGMALARPGGIYNLADDLPAPQADVIAYAARLLGVAAPPLIALDSADIGPLTREFYGVSRRVDNSRLKRELGVALRYPTYREGLPSCLPPSS